jgi:hypothetical protein
MEIEWRKIEGYDYSISSLGQVRNDRTGRILKPWKHRDGYFQVTLYKNGKQKWSLVHRLVAMFFILNPENKPEINHKNLIKADNRVENLEWCTAKENIQHAIKNGKKGGCFQKNHKFGVGSKNGRAKLTKDRVLEIRELYATGNYILKELGKEFDVSQAQISHIVNNKKWAHI